MSEAVYFDEGNFISGLSVLNRYAGKLVELEEVLKEHRIDFSMDAMRKYITGTDAIAQAIIQQQNKEMEGLPEIFRRKLVSPVDLRPVDPIMRELEYMAREFIRFQQQAGRLVRVAIDFIGKDGNHYAVDEAALRDHFTVYSTKVINDAIRQATALKKAYNEFKAVCSELGIRMVGSYGDNILVADIDGFLDVNLGAVRFIGT